MFIKVCILSFSLGMIIFLDLSRTATALRCHNCIGSRKEPDQDPTCNQTHNCTGAENTCMKYIVRYRNQEPQTYMLICQAGVDCKRHGVGCVDKSNDKTICTTCCTSDLCNDPTQAKENVNGTNDSASGRIQILPFTCYLATLIGMWFGA